MTFDPGPAPADADDHVLAGWLAETAGRRLLEVRQEGLEGRELKDAGDLAAHELLMDLLAEHRRGDAVLSEEGKDDKVRLTSDRVWIVDPLDGTREFSEPPRDDWAVHVALWQGRDGEGDLVAGAVAQPGLGQTFTTGRPPVVPSSTGAKVISVVRDVSDAYVHAGGQYEWDSAAPVAVARAAGLFTSRVDGSPLRYNQDDVYLPDLVVCRPELVDQILAHLREYGVDRGSAQ